MYLFNKHIWKLKPAKWLCIFKNQQVVLEPRVSPEHTSKYVDTVIVFAKTWTKGHWSLDDLWPHICWGLMCDSTLGSLCPSPMKIHQSMWIQWPFLQKLEAKVIDPFDPTSVEVTCVTLPKDHCVQVPWKYIKVCGYSDPFCKTWTKGQWPLDDLWPHICWGFMCDSTPGSLCPSPMKIHQSMWIQWPFCKNLNQRSLIPRWHLTPHLLRSHVWLYPRIIVSKSHGIHWCM